MTFNGSRLTVTFFFMFRLFAVSTLILGLACSAQAGEKTNSEPAPASSEAQVPVQQLPVKPAQTRPTPGSFEPSEKIEAGSALAFPVDI